MKERVEDLHPAVLQCVDELSTYLKQDAMAQHDSNDLMVFMWTFEHKGDPVQIHMIKTQNGGYALAAADFGQDGVLAKSWTRSNGGKWKGAKRIVCQTQNLPNIYVGQDGVDDLIY
jgi:hypothetical protein